MFNVARHASTLRVRVLQQWASPAHWMIAKRAHSPPAWTMLRLRSVPASNGINSTGVTGVDVPAAPATAALPLPPLPDVPAIAVMPAIGGIPRPPLPATGLLTPATGGGGGGAMNPAAGPLA